MITTLSSCNLDDYTGGVLYILIFSFVIILHTLLSYDTILARLFFCILVEGKITLVCVYISAYEIIVMNV